MIGCVFYVMQTTHYNIDRLHNVTTIFSKTIKRILRNQRYLQCRSFIKQIWSTLQLATEMLSDTVIITPLGVQGICNIILLCFYMGTYTFVITDWRRSLRFDYRDCLIAWSGIIDRRWTPLLLTTRRRCPNVISG